MNMPPEGYTFFVIILILSTIGCTLGSLLFWAAAFIYTLAPNKWYRDKRVRYFIVPVLTISAILLTILTYYSFKLTQYFFYLRLSMV